MNLPVRGLVGTAEGKGRACRPRSPSLSRRPLRPVPSRGLRSVRAPPQVPIHALWSDGRENLLGALLMAGQYVIPEVPPPPGAGAWALRAALTCD